MEQQFKANVSIPFDGAMDVMLTLRDDDDDALFNRLQWWFANLLDVNILPKVSEGPAPRKEPAAEAESKSPPRKSEKKASPPQGGGDSDVVLVPRTSRDSMTICMTENGDKVFTKIKCGEWRAHGVKAWPEVYDPFDVDISEELAGKTYDLPSEVVAYKVQIVNGKPTKVIELVHEEPA